MNIKSVFVALSVTAIVVLGNGATASAQTNETDKKVETSVKETVEVKAGDTLDAIGARYNTTYVRLFNANESIAHPDRIDVGNKVTIPTKDEVLPDRYADLMKPVVQAPAAVATATPASVAAPATAQCNEATQWVRADNGQCLDKPVASRQVAAQPSRQAAASATVSYNSTSYSTGNGMWCTDYVHSKRPDVPIYGNAGMNWIGAAQSQGKATGTTPRAGAVAVTNGHVAYVEAVHANGTYTVSEMGWMYKPGNFNRRTVSPGAFGGFIY